MKTLERKTPAMHEWPEILSIMPLTCFLFWVSAVCHFETKRTKGLRLNDAENKKEPFIDQMFSDFWNT